MVSVADFSRNNAAKFARQVLGEARSVGLPVGKETVDHVCFRVATDEEYRELCSSILQNKIDGMRAELLAESEVNGRMISTFRLESPLEIEDQKIEAVEIPAPKKGRKYQTGFEHIEVVSAMEFEQLKLLTPQLTFDELGCEKLFNPELAWSGSGGVIKFHHLPLSCVIGIELFDGALETILEQNLFQSIKGYYPICSGSIPLGVHHKQSDLDVLLTANDLHRALIELKQILVKFGDIKIDSSAIETEKCFTMRLGLRKLTIEFYCSTLPRLMQRSHRHLLNEWKLLVRHGKGLKDKVIQLKQSGQKTEEAFCNALGLSGDPFDILLRCP